MSGNDFKDILTQIWKGIFEEDDIDDDTSFYDLGGNSILANEMVRVVGEELGTTITASDIYECDTLGTLIHRCTVLQDKTGEE